MTWPQRAIFGAAIVLYLALAGLTVYTRRPWVDEAWAGVPAWSLATHGNTATPSFDASGMGPHGMLRVDTICYWQAPLYLAVQALWYQIFPFSLWSMRWLSVAAGLAGMLCWAVFLKRLTGDIHAAGLMTLLMSCAYMMDSASGFGRPDALSFAFQAAAFASYFVLRETRFNWALLVSQAFVAASGLTHPNGGMLSFFGTAFLILYFDRARLNIKQLAIAAAPYLAGGLAWGAYILKDSAAFLSQYGAQAEGRFAGLRRPLAAIRSELVLRYVQIMGLGRHSAGSSGPIFLKSLLYAAFAVGIGGVLLTPNLRKNKPVRSLLWLLAIYLFFYTFLEGTKATYYMIYIIYIYAALFALWLSYYRTAGRLSKPMLALVIAGLMLVEAGGTLQRARANAFHNSFLPAVAYLRQHAAPGSLIMGSYEMGFALGFGNNFLDDYRLGLASGKIPDFIVVEEIYEDRFRMLQMQRPQEYQRFLELLKQYHEVYNQNFYRILARNGA